MAQSRNTAKRAQGRPGAQSQARRQMQPRSQPEPNAAAANGSAIEQQVVAFAEQLGRVVGTVQAKAEGWLDPQTLNEQITRVRDGATSLLQQIGAAAEATTGRLTTLSAGGRGQATGAATSGSAGADRSGGAVDAPGKKHRKPTPNEPLPANAADKGRIAKMKAAAASRTRGRG